MPHSFASAVQNLRRARFIRIGGRKRCRQDWLVVGYGNQSIETLFTKCSERQLLSANSVEEASFFNHSASIHLTRRESTPAYQSRLHLWLLQTTPILRRLGNFLPCCHFESLIVHSTSALDERVLSAQRSEKASTRYSHEISKHAKARTAAAAISSGRSVPTGRLHSLLTKQRARPATSPLAACYIPARLLVWRSTRVSSKPKSPSLSGALLGTASACISHTATAAALQSLHEVLHLPLLNAPARSRIHTTLQPAPTATPPVCAASARCTDLPGALELRSN